MNFESLHGGPPTPWSSQRSCCPCSNTCRNTTVRVGISQIPRWVDNGGQVIQGLKISCFSWSMDPLKWGETSNKKKHTCKLAMNSRMQSHDVILPTWKVPEYLYSVERYALLSYDSLWLSAMTMDHPRVLFAAKARWSLPVAENSLSCMDWMALEHGHSMSFHHSLLIPSHPSKDSTLELSNPCLMQIIWMSTVARSQVVPKDPSDQFLLVTNMSCVPSQ